MPESSGAWVENPDGTKREMTREEALAVLGFIPADVVTPRGPSRYVQVVGKPVIEDKDDA